MVSAGFALDPLLNVRVFPAGDGASTVAARTFVGGRAATFEAGVRNVVFEAPEAVVEAVQEVLRRDAPGQGGRCWLRGTSRRIASACSKLGTLSPAGLGLAQEIADALSACDRASSDTTSTLVMGILNVTPDSFSDGGEWAETGAALERGLQLVGDGADIVDVGGESTRPGAPEVPAAEELRRVLPVVRALRAASGVLISVDTRKSQVAAASLSEGANWINDVSGLQYDPRLAEEVARYPEARLVLMHSRRKPCDDHFSTEYTAAGRPVYEDVVADTARWLRGQVQVALHAGVSPERIWIDPGFGFGKAPEQNLDLLRRLREYTSLGLPVLIGTSRKSTVGHLLGGLPPREREEGTAATVAWAITHGAAAVRVHEVRALKRLARATDVLQKYTG